MIFPLVAMAMKDGELLAIQHGIRLDNNQNAVLRFGAFIGGEGRSLTLPLRAALALGLYHLLETPFSGEAVLLSETPAKECFELGTSLPELGFNPVARRPAIEKDLEYVTLWAEPYTLLGAAEAALAGWDIQYSDHGIPE